MEINQQLSVLSSDRSTIQLHVWHVIVGRTNNMANHRQYFPSGLT